jgi:L-ascorbate metabolism protein UlaG (beta-lactamase superfamily)
MYQPWSGFHGHAILGRQRERPMQSIRFLLAGFVLFAAGGTSAAQFAQAPKPEMTEGCPGLISQARPRVIPAALSADQVRITFIGHSTFLLESPKLVRIATDYNDYVKPPVLPEVVTMNHAHSTHYTDHPDPAIQYVLRGWAEEYGKPVRHDIQIRDVRVRNVPTNIRTWSGEGTERHGNSIFIYEMGTLCVAHLGHLHHTLNQQQLNEIGRVDVVMFPVDGTYTLDLDGMVEVLQSLKAQLMIPMHYFSAFTLDRFLERVRGTFDVQIGDTPSIVVSKTSLPAKPQILVLPGR